MRELSPLRAPDPNHIRNFDDEHLGKAHDRQHHLAGNYTLLGHGTHAVAVRRPLRSILRTVDKVKNPERTSKDKSSGTTRRSLVENEIYEHATRLFAEHGFAGTTLQDIAEAVGVTRPALYYYFKSKDAILAKLVHEITQEPATHLQEISARDDLTSSEKLRQLARITATRIATHAERFRLLIKSEGELPDEILTPTSKGGGRFWPPSLR